MSLWNKLWKSIWKVLPCSFGWELHELIVKVLHWFGLVESLRGSFAWVIFMRQHKEHHNITQFPQRQTLSSLLIRKLGQQPPSWLDKIIYSAVSLALERGTTVQPLGLKPMQEQMDETTSVVHKTQELRKIYRILQWRSTQDSIYGRRCIRYK